MQKEIKQPNIKSKESKEQRLQIRHQFFYSQHEKGKDFEGMKAFKDFDIYVPEAINWTEIDKRIFKFLSLQNLITPEKVAEILLKGSEEKIRKFKETFAFSEWKFIYNSKKPVLFVDIPSKDKNFLKRKKEKDLLLKEAVKLFKTGDFKNAINKYRNFIESYAKLNLERENEIKKNLDREIRELIKTNPDYAKKEELKVLISLGSIHTKIYHDLKKEGKQVSRKFNKSPYVFTQKAESLRLIMFDKELPDEILAQGMLNDFFVNYSNLVDLIKDEVKLHKIIRKICSPLTIKDIEKISKNLGLGKNFTKEIEELGIEIPKSEREIDELLKEQFLSYT